MRLWTTVAYANGVTFTANGTVGFKAIETAGNEAVGDVFTVGNIDTTVLVITLTGDNSTPIRAATLAAGSSPLEPHGIVVYMALPDWFK